MSKHESKLISHLQGVLNVLEILEVVGVLVDHNLLTMDRMLVYTQSYFVFICIYLIALIGGNAHPANIKRR
jgi:hypothetical protein